MENSVDDDFEGLLMENSDAEAFPMEDSDEEALPMENFDVATRSSLLLQLPRSVLMEEVLGKLPLLDIVRLSCVCRSFRGLLKESRFLTIDERIFQGTYFQRYANGQNFSQLEHNLERFIDWIFSNHNAELHTFALNFQKFDSSMRFDSAKLSDWLTSAAAKQVRNIMIHAYASHWLVVPVEVYLCKHLTVLKLREVGFAFCPSQDSGDIMPCLSECSLVNVRINEQGFNHFVKCCPILQKLCLKNCIEIGNAEVHSKNLVSFQFHCTYAMNSARTSLTAVCPALDSLLVRFDRDSCESIKVKVSAPQCRILETNCSLLRQFVSFKQLERLTVHENTFCGAVPFSMLASFPKIEWVCLSCVDVRSIDIGMQFPYLKRLRFPIAHYGLEELAFMGSTLRSAPFMENMNVDAKCCLLEKMLGSCERCEKQLGEGAFRVHIAELERTNPNSRVVLVNHSCLVFGDSFE